MRIAVVAPYANPHFLEIINLAGEQKGLNVTVYCFRDLPVHRQELGWQTAPDVIMVGKSWRRFFQLIRDSRDFDAILLLGLIDPMPWQVFVGLSCRFRNDGFILVSEGLKSPNIGCLRRTAIARFFNTPRIKILAIGTGSDADWKSIGLTKPRYYRFGFAEKFNASCESLARRKNTREEIIILAVGQLIERKNFSSVIRSLCTLRPSRSVIFRICGDGPLRERIVEEARKLPSTCRLELIGNCTREELCSHFDAADIFVMPSQYDGWGVVLNQAIHHHLPVVVSANVRAARDHLVCHGENGFVFNCESELDIYLAKLIEDANLRVAFSGACERIASVWSIDEMANRLGEWLIARGEISCNSGPLEEINQS